MLDKLLNTLEKLGYLLITQQKLKIGRITWRFWSVSGVVENMQIDSNLPLIFVRYIIVDINKNMKIKD